MKKDFAGKAAGTILFIVVLFIIFGMIYMHVGFPLSYMINKGKAQRYVAANFTDEEYVMWDYGFDFVGPYYYAEFECTDEDKPDNHFYLHLNSFGKITGNSYDQITEGWNTAFRLDDDYWSIYYDVKSASPSDIFNENFSGGVNLDFYDDEDTNDEKLTYKDLIPNKEYDIIEIAEKQGIYYATVIDENASLEKACYYLQQMKKYINDAGCPFKYANLTLVKDRDDYSDSISVENFPCELITDDNLIETIDDYIRR